MSVGTLVAAAEYLSAYPWNLDFLVGAENA